MRRHKILTCVLILSIIKLALAAPTGARREVRLDANVVTNSSQKRRDSLTHDKRASKSLNVPGPDHAPQNLGPTDLLSQMFNMPWSQIAQLTGQMENANRPPHPPVIPGSLTGPRLSVAGSLPPRPAYLSQPWPLEDHFPGPPGSPITTHSSSSINNYDVPPNSGQPIGSRLPVGPMPVAGSLSNHLPPPPRPSQPRPPEDHSLGPPDYSEKTYTLFLSTDNHYVPPSTEWPTGSRLPVGPILDLNTLPEDDSPSHLPPHPSQPGPSYDRSPGSPGFSVESDTSSSDSNPTPPQSPELDPEIHSLLNPEPFPTDFWDEFFKGRIKRRMSDFDAVDLA